MATFHFAVIGVVCMTIAVLLDGLHPRVPVAPEALVTVFFACIVLFFTGWFFRRPAWMLPRRYRPRR